MKIAMAFVVMLSIVSSLHAQEVKTESGPDGPAQITFAPAGGQGRVVILISGGMGLDFYEFYGIEIAKLGYYAVLLDGHEIFNHHGGPFPLQKAIARAQHSPSALPGKVAVVGFSLGGGAALVYATQESNLVSGVVAYYPLTNFITGPSDMKTLVGSMKVPVLVFAGGKDTYLGSCCLIEVARNLASVAKELDVPLELVVYPEAEHGFNLNVGYGRWPVAGAAFNGPATADAWQRTVVALHQYLGG
jgi:dienelactone hydrolase